MGAFPSGYRLPLCVGARIMSIMRRVRFARLMVALVILGTWGCASTGPSAVSHSLRRVAVDDRQALFDAAEAALLDLGHAIDQRDATEGLLRTVPVETADGGQRRRGGPRLSSGRLVRQVTEVRVQRGAIEASLFCRVMIQEQTTGAYRMHAQAMRGSDVPNETAIDRDAATTAEQNTVWQTVRRDRAAESAVLAAILERAGVSPDASGGPSG